MPARRPGGSVADTYHAPKKRRRTPASQGHPSRGGTTVSGGTRHNRTVVPYTSPTPSVRTQRRRRREIAARPEPDVTLRGDRKRKRSGHEYRPPLQAALERTGVIGDRTFGTTRREVRDFNRRASRPSVAEASLGSALEAFGASNPVTQALGHSAINFATSSKVRSETGKGLRGLPAGLIAGTLGAITDPVGTGKSQLKVWGETYKPVLEKDWDEFKDVQEKEGGGGVLQVASDAAIALPGASLIAGKLGAKGALGRAVKRTMTEPRPKLRHEGGVQEQEISPFYFAARRQRRRDESRRAVYEGRMDKARREEGYGPTTRPHAADEVVGRGALATRGGRVVAPLPKRLQTSERLGRKAQARGKGARRLMQLEEQSDRMKQVVDTVGRRMAKWGNLSKGQQDAFRYVVGGLVDAVDPARAVRQLRQLREFKLEGRALYESKGKRVRIPRPRLKYNDEIRVIDSLIERIESGEEVMGPTLQAASKDMRKLEVELASGRVDLEQVPIPGRISQTQLRRYMPQAEFLATMDQKARARARREGTPEPEGLLPAALDGEHWGAYIERIGAGSPGRGLRKIIERAQQHGLQRPAYFPSERRFGRGKPSNQAIGGSKGLVDDRTYKGELFRTGREDVRPEVFIAGMMRSIKRKHAMNLMADQIDRAEIDIGLPERAQKTARNRRAKERYRQKRAQEEAAARELGVTRKDLKAIAGSIARNRRKGQQHMEDVYVPRLRQLRDAKVQLQVRIGSLNMELTDRSRRSYQEELVRARDALEGKVEAAKRAGMLERWGELKAERDRAQKRLGDLVDENFRLFAQSNRLHRESEALEEEIMAIERGDRITGAPEREARDTLWYHGTTAQFEDLRAPEANARSDAGRTTNDLGVYLTSDPEYAGQYSGRNGPGSSRVVQTYVQPRKTLETRFGRVQSGDIIDLAQSLLDRADRAAALMHERYDPLLDSISELNEKKNEVMYEDVRRVGEEGNLGAGEAEAKLEALDAQINRMREMLPPGVRYGFNGRDGIRAESRRALENAVRALTEMDEWGMAFTGQGPRRFETLRGNGGPVANDALKSWREIDNALMRDAPTDVAEMEALAAGSMGPIYTQYPTREILREMGYDSIRKVDVRADALVVIDDKILRKAPSTTRTDELFEAEADLRSAHDGLREVRDHGTAELLEDAQKVVAEAEKRFDKALGDARDQVRERAGEWSAQSAHDRLVRDSIPGSSRRTVKEIVDDLESALIDPDDVVLMQPRRVYADYGHGPGVTPARSRAAERHAGDDSNPSMADALEGAVVDGRQAFDALRAREGGLSPQYVEGDPLAFMDEHGWVAVPKAFGEEVMSGLKGGTLFPRLWDIGKGQTSRVLLGFLNMSWLPFQIMSNAFLSGVVGHVGPRAWLEAQRWWSGLTSEQRSALRPLVGQSAHHLDFDKRYLGAAAANNTIVAAWQAWKKQSWWQASGKYNPITLMFRGDAAQNLFFRRAVLYSDAKRRMFTRMGESMQDMTGLQNTITRTLTKDGQRQLTDYLEDRPTLELHGRKVDELLGDYLSYTDFERRVLQRGVMFYGFVRHSTRLALWTLPTKHPITTAILGKLALLGAEEAREILGGDQLPWGLGKFYVRQGTGFADLLDALPIVEGPHGTDPVTGKPNVMEIDLARMSPAANAFMDIRKAEDFVRFAPPYVAWGVEQLTEKNLLRGQPWKVRGMSQGIPNPQDLDDYTLSDHLKVFLGQISSVVPPARYAENVTFVGPQGDDANIFTGDAETQYKDPDIRKSIAQGKRRRENMGMGGRILGELFPMLPTRSDDPGIAKGRRERQAESDAAKRNREEDHGGESAVESYRRRRREGSAGSGARDALKSYRDRN